MVYATRGAFKFLLALSASVMKNERIPESGIHEQADLVELWTIH